MLSEFKARALTCCLQHLEQEASQLAARPATSVRHLVWHLRWARVTLTGTQRRKLPYDECVARVLPKSLADPPNDAIVANATMHSEYIYWKARNAARMSAHCVCSRRRQWMAVLRIVHHHCPLRLLSYECANATCSARGLTTSAAVHAHSLCLDAVPDVRTRCWQVALLTHSQFASRWVAPVDVEDYFEFRDTAAAIPPPALSEPLGTASDRLWAEYETRYRAGDAKVVIDATGSADAVAAMKASMHVVMRGTDATGWSDVSSIATDAVRMYGLRGVDDSRIVALLSRWFFSVPRAELTSA